MTQSELLQQTRDTRLTQAPNKPATSLRSVSPVTRDWHSTWHGQDIWYLMFSAASTGEQGHAVGMVCKKSTLAGLPGKKQRHYWLIASCEICQLNYLQLQHFCSLDLAQPKLKTCQGAALHPCHCCAPSTCLPPPSEQSARVAEHLGLEYLKTKQKRDNCSLKLQRHMHSSTQVIRWKYRATHVSKPLSSCLNIKEHPRGILQVQ